MILVIALSLIVGFSIGMMGVGGIFLTPFLILLTDLEMSTAMGTALITFIGTGLLGSYIYQQEGNINWHFVLYLAPSSVLGAISGSNLNLALSEATLERILAIFLMVMAVIIFSKQRKKAIKIKDKQDFNKLFYLAIGFITGLASGLFGVGGPVLMVPLLSSLGWPILMAVGVSQVISVFSALSGSFNYLVNARVDFTLAFIILVAELIGVFFGGKLAHKINKDYLIVLLCFMLFGLGIYFIN